MSGFALTITIIIVLYTTHRAGQKEQRVMLVFQQRSIIHSLILTAHALTPCFCTSDVYRYSFFIRMSSA